MNVALSKKGLRSLPSFLSRSRVRQIVSAVFKKEKIKSPGDVNIVFVDNRIIRHLNRVYLDEKALTDVIAFPYEKTLLGKNEVPFGDIYICVPVARSNAARFGVPFQEELIRLIIHGLLHLVGYDDHAAQKRKKMWERQEFLVRKLNGG